MEKAQTYKLVRGNTVEVKSQLELVLCLLGSLVVTKSVTQDSSSKMNS